MTFDDAFIIITGLLVGLFFIGGAVALTAIIGRVLEWLKD